MTAGKTVLITRAAADAAALGAVVEACGGRPLFRPAIAARYDHPSAQDRAALDDLRPFSAIAFASRHGVVGLHRARPKDALPEQTALCVVGPGTDDALFAAFGRRGHVALRHDALALAECVCAHTPQNGRVLVPTTATAGGPLCRALEEAGRRPIRVALYRTEVLHRAPEAHSAVTNAAAADYIIFTSPSCVAGWQAQGQVARGAKILSMGPATSRAARALGLTVHAEARPSSFAGLAALIQEQLCPSQAIF